MATQRVKIARDKADLVKGLTTLDGKTGPFPTYADVIVFAACLGARYHRRLPIDEVSKREPSPIALDIFTSRGYDSVIKLLSITTTKNPQILSHLSPEAGDDRILIFEEYANGGLEILQERLRGSIDYTDMLLLLLSEEKDRSNAPTAEFDLSRFLT